MATNLTGSTIASTYEQLLHMDGGPEATEKVVYSGTGTATALKVGTQSASIDNLKVDGNTLSSTNTDGDINITPNGSGAVNVTNINVVSGSIPISVLTNAYGIFYDNTNQTFSADTPTTVEFNVTGIANDITLANDGSGNPTRVTFTNAGTYEVSSRLQFDNADTSDRNADIWFRLNGSDIPYSASEIAVPKTGDGGKICHSITGVLTVTAGQYIEIVVAVVDTDISLHYHAPLVSPGDAYDRPAVPSAIIVVKRIA